MPWSSVSQRHRLIIYVPERLTFGEKIVLLALGFGQQTVFVWSLGFVLCAHEHSKERPQLIINVHRAAVAALWVCARIQ